MSVTIIKLRHKFFPVIFTVSFDHGGFSHGGDIAGVGIFIQGEFVCFGTDIVNIIGGARKREGFIALLEDLFPSGGRGRVNNTEFDWMDWDGMFTRKRVQGSTSGFGFNFDEHHEMPINHPVSKVGSVCQSV